jgi:NADP-dependent 3-hydroxy acid dehydrogenase YdfG
MLEGGGGTVILVSSMAALRPGPMAGTAYGTAKAAARNYMAGLAAELRQKGIRATTIFPGEVDTPILENRPLPPTDEQKAGMMQAEDIAEAVLLAATLPPRTVIEELTIMPTRLRDYSADIAASKKMGAP